MTSSLSRRVSRRALLQSVMSSTGAIAAMAIVGCGEDEGPLPMATPPRTAAPPPASPTAGAAFPPPGVGTWAAVEASGEAPGPRRDPTLTTVVAALSANPPGGTEDAVLPLFGGRTAGVATADLWSFDIGSKQWTRIDAAGPAPRFGHNAFFDFTRARLVVTLGQNETTFYNDVWAYDFAAATWLQLDAASAERPEVRYGAGGAHDVVGDRILVSHGFTDQGRFDDTWAFSFDTNQWSRIQTEGPVPIKRCLHRTLWVPQRGEMLLFGGQTDTNPFLGDFWSLDPAGGAWTERTSAGLPGPRNLAGASLNADGSTWYLAGGNTPEGPSAETWAYDLASDEWSLVEAAGALPARYSGDAAIAGDALYVFGGHDGSRELGDLWSLPL